MCAGFPKSFPRIQMLPLPQLSRRASNNKRISFYMQTESEQSSMNALKTFNNFFFDLSTDSTLKFCSFFYLHIACFHKKVSRYGDDYSDQLFFVLLMMVMVIGNKPNRLYFALSPVLCHAHPHSFYRVK